LSPKATSLTAGERSDTETVTLREARGDWKRAMVKWYLASRLLNLVHPFEKSHWESDSLDSLQMDESPGSNGRWVQPLMMVDNSAFSPKSLDNPLGLAYSSFPELSMLIISSGEDPMTFHVFVLFLVFLLLLYLAWLCRLYWLHHGLSHWRARVVHPVVHRLLKARTQLDCPACRLTSPLSPVVGPSPLSVHPGSEVKSRRGVPKRVNTEGFACPNQQCAYFGITDAHIHALVGDGKHGSAERIQTFRCQACHTTFSARRHTPLYRLKTPSQQVAMVLSALSEGLDPSAAEWVFGYRQATITTWLNRAGKHAQTLHERFFCHLHLPHLQLDELRTRLRSYKQVLWLWLAIDPCTKLLPVLQLGPRTQHMAHLLIHSLRQSLAAFLLAALHQ
jgi:hypothetical protein